VEFENATQASKPTGFSIVHAPTGTHTHRTTKSVVYMQGRQIRCSQT